MYAWMVVNVNISTDEIENVEHIQYIETKPINFGDDTHNRSLFCQQCSFGSAFLNNLKCHVWQCHKDNFPKYYTEIIAFRISYSQPDLSDRNFSVTENVTDKFLYYSHRPKHSEPLQKRSSHSDLIRNYKGQPTRRNQTLSKTIDGEEDHRYIYHSPHSFLPTMRHFL